MHIVSTFSDRLPFLLEVLRKIHDFMALYPHIKISSLVLEDVDGDEDKHGGVDEKQQ